LDERSPLEAVSSRRCRLHVDYVWQVE
jgi:hypothetical protein